LVKVYRPFPPGWIGCLDDQVLDALMFHVGKRMGVVKVANPARTN
jgi:hypothetical protein